MDGMYPLDGMIPVRDEDTTIRVHRESPGIDQTPRHGGNHTTFYLTNRAVAKIGDVDDTAASGQVTWIVESRLRYGQSIDESRRPTPGDTFRNSTGNIYLTNAMISGTRYQ